MASSGKRNSIFTGGRNYGSISGSNALKPSATSPNSSSVRLGSNRRIDRNSNILKEQYQQAAGIQAPTPTPVNTSRPNEKVREHKNIFAEQAKQQDTSKQEPVTTPVNNAIPFPSPTPTQPSPPTIAAPPPPPPVATTTPTSAPEPPPAVNSAPTAPATPLSSTPKIISTPPPAPPSVSTTPATAPNNADTHTITKANEALSQSSSKLEQHHEAAEAQYKQSQKLTQGHDLATLGSEVNEAAPTATPTEEKPKIANNALPEAAATSTPISSSTSAPTLSYVETKQAINNDNIRASIANALHFGIYKDTLLTADDKDFATIMNISPNEVSTVRAQVGASYDTIFEDISGTNKYLRTAAADPLMHIELNPTVVNEIADNRKNFAFDLKHSLERNFSVRKITDRNKDYEYSIDQLQFFDAIADLHAQNLTPEQYEAKYQALVAAQPNQAAITDLLNNHAPDDKSINRNLAYFSWYKMTPHEQIAWLNHYGVAGATTFDEDGDIVIPREYIYQYNELHKNRTFIPTTKPHEPIVSIRPVTPVIPIIVPPPPAAEEIDEGENQPILSRDNYDGAEDDSLPPDYDQPASPLPQPLTTQTLSAPPANYGLSDNEEYGDQIEERTPEYQDYQQARSGEDLDTDDGQTYQEPEQQTQQPRQQREQQPEERPEQQQSDEQQPNQENSERQQQPEQKRGENQPETKESQPQQGEQQSGDQSPDQTKLRERNKPGEKTGNKPDPTKPHQKVDKQFGKGPTSKQNPKLGTKKPNVKGIKGVGQKIGNGLKNVGSKAAQGAKAAARAAAKAAQAAAKVVAQLASKLAPLMANPYFWIVVAVIAVIVLIIILVTGGTGSGSGINSTAKDNDSGAVGSGGDSVFMNENDCLQITKSVTPTKLEGSDTPYEFATYTYSLSLDPQCANITFDGSCSDIETITCNNDTSLTDTQCPDPNAPGTPTDWVDGKRDLSPFVCAKIAEALTGDPSGDITGQSLGGANTTKCNGTQISWIGDSISNAARAQINGKFPGVSIDAIDGRTWVQGITAASNTPLREYVVFALGANSASLTAADITNAINAITASGGQKIIFITNAGLSDSGNSLNNNYNNNNTLFSSTGNPNVTVINWASAIASDPEKYLRRDPDGVTVHPTDPEGTMLFADTAFNTLDCGSEAETPTSTTPSSPSSLVFTLDVDVPEGNNFKQDNVITLGYTASIYGNLMTGTGTPENSGGAGDCTVFHTTANGQQVPFCFQMNSTLGSYVPDYGLAERGCGPTSAAMAVAGTGKWTGTTKELFQKIVEGHENTAFSFADIKNSAIAAGAQSETKNFPGEPEEVEADFRTYVNNQLSQGRFVIIKLSISNSKLPRNKHVIYTGSGAHYILLTELLADGTIFINNSGSVNKNYAATQDQIFGEAATIIDAGGGSGYQATTIW